MNNKFLFGVATSSHQNEGNNYLNNWWDWEVKNNLERSGVACNSWIDYRKDIDCVKELGCNSYRFSIEWSRIFPSERKIDEGALEKYEAMIDYCLENDIEPVVTLHHFTRPKWFDRRYGGIHSDEIMEYFGKYVREVVEKIGGKVRWWITFNEPMLECVNGYLRGTRPPGMNGDFEMMYKALVNIIDCHCLAYDIIKDKNPDAMVSIAKNLVDFEKQYNYDLVKSRIEDQVIENFNWGLLDAFYHGEFRFGINLAGIGMKKVRREERWRGRMDFLGINHYNVGYVEIKYSTQNPINVVLRKKERGFNKNFLGWDIKPKSMNVVLDMVMGRYGGIPVMITESGGCEKNDSRSKTPVHNEIMETHLKSVMEHRSEYGNIIGYMWWTLVDNFEWDDGWKPKFGLYKLIEKDGKLFRKIKGSGKKYQEIIKNYKES